MASLEKRFCFNKANILKTSSFIAVGQDLVSNSVRFQEHCCSHPACHTIGYLANISSLLLYDLLCCCLCVLSLRRRSVSLELRQSFVSVQSLCSYMGWRDICLGIHPGSPAKVGTLSYIGNGPCLLWDPQQCLFALSTAICNASCLLSWSHLSHGRELACHTNTPQPFHILHSIPYSKII